MSKVKLKMEDLSGFGRPGAIAWEESEPFVENLRGLLVHRVRRVTSRIHPTKGYRYLCVEYWCGNGANGEKKFSFHSAPPQGKYVCESCERRAGMFGQPSSSSLAGKHVCTGRIKAYNSCKMHGEDK